MILGLAGAIIIGVIVASAIIPILVYLIGTIWIAVIQDIKKQIKGKSE